MLSKSKAFGGFSVNDIDAAMQFYKDKLGLHVEKDEMGLLELHIEAGNALIIYQKKDHQPASFTVLNFPVDDINKAVDELTAKGISFEQYKNLGTDEKGIAHNDGPLIAWFKDPAGNILSVIEVGE